MVTRVQNSIMQLKNKYVFRSNIFEAEFRQIVELFALDLGTTQILGITKVSHIIWLFYHLATFQVFQSMPMNNFKLRN